MEVLRCKKGHYYDSVEYDKCPFCEKQIDNPINNEIWITQKLAPEQAEVYVAKTISADEQETVLLLSQEDQPPKECAETMNAAVANPMQSAKQKPEKIMEVGPHYPPVVGWLICNSGVYKGTAYRIWAQMNYIGSNPSMDICIIGDTSVKKEKAAFIEFDAMKNQFIFGPCENADTVRVNGQVALNEVTLNQHDCIMVGGTELLFMPV